jgi:non-canonical (house-cleaning) NTP pyrophosphatase
MKEVVLSSSNEAKKRAALQAITEIFGAGNVLKTLEAPSGVSATPMSFEESIQGAKNRVTHSRQMAPNADYYIGAEGGVGKIADQWFIGGWVVVENKVGEQHLAASALVELPFFLVSRLDADTPLSQSIEETDFPVDLYERRNVLGTNGLITNGTYSRVTEFYDALRIALSLFHKPE